MAQLIKIGKKYYSDYTEKCNGSRCPTPSKPNPHWHRRRRAHNSDKSFAQIDLGYALKIREAAKKGEVVADISWSDFKGRYLEYSATKKPKTHDQDKRAIAALESAFAFARVEQLSVERLEKFKEVLSTSRSHHTVNRYLQAIRAMLKKAIQWKLIVDPGYESVKYFKTAKGRVKFYSVDELKLMRKEQDPFWQKVVMLGFYAGLRREEMRSLPVQHIDLKRNRINIEKTDEFTPKDYECRFIPIHPKLRRFLIGTINGSKFVLGDHRISLHAMTKKFAKKLSKIGLTGSLHTLRHSFGAHNAMAGVSPHKLKEWMGHSNLKTLEIYSHLSQEHLDQDIERMPSI